MAHVLESPGWMAGGALAVGPTIASTATIPVLHLINGEHYSGAERVQDLLALALGEFGFNVGFACLKLGRFAEMRQAQRAILLDARMGSRFDLSGVARLARLLKQHRFALLHAHTPRAAMVGRLAAAIAGSETDPGHVAVPPEQNRAQLRREMMQRRREVRGSAR